jgi:formylglycine-generating enzyme
MRAPRGIVLVAVASGLGGSACAAFLSDFSIGDGADSGAAEGAVAESGASQDGKSDDAGSTNDGSVADGGGDSGTDSDSGESGLSSGGDGGDGGDSGTALCAPMATKCTSSTQMETCGTDGQWGAATTCTSSQTCSAGVCVRTDGGTVEPPSCVPGGVGMTNCGPSGNESCCTSIDVTGGTFYRSYDGVSAGYTSTASPATVSTFALDKYEITVGRFRQFVVAWDSGWTPPAGAGKHSYLNGGSGLANSGVAGTYEAGWNTEWTSALATTASVWTTNLSCGASWQTWTPSPGANENLPIDCVTGYEAYAFCIWDNGFLPSEAEWNYAAAGGGASDGQRVYPWSSPSTSLTIDCSYSNYSACGDAPNAVGSESPKGDGKWGQADLAGNVWEWALDWDAAYANPCTDCAYLTSVGSSDNGIYRGGSGTDQPGEQLVSFRGAQAPPSNRYFNIGARCARVP